MILSKKYPLYVSLFAYVASLIALMMYSYAKNHLISYSIDDVYIHSAIARNFSQYGIWGVTPYGFSHTASSVLYILILFFGYLLFGVNLWLPLAINIISSILIIISVYRIFAKQDVRPFITLLILLGIVFVTPLAGISMYGMEHLVHTYLSVLFVYYLSLYLSGVSHNPEIVWRKCVLLLVLSFLLVASRYEGLFLIGAGAFLLALRRQWRLSIAILAASLVSISVLGLYAMLHGSYFFPNSVLLKKNSTDVVFHYILPHFWWIISKLWPLLIIIVAIFAAYCRELYVRIRRKTFWEIDNVAVFLFVSMLIAHILFARINLSFRYEVYLIITGFFVAGLYLHARFANWRFGGFGKKIVLVLLVIFVLCGFYVRGIAVFRKVIPAIKNIHDQQFQMARFLHKYYDSGSVAANDIGAITYFTSIKLLDLVGLGSIEVTRMRNSDVGELDLEYADYLVHDKKIDVIVIHNNLFKTVPVDWIPAGQWTISNNVVAGSDTVVFYALDAEKARMLKDNLRDFAPAMPSDIKVVL